jgi:hypothetical protein
MYRRNAVGCRNRFAGEGEAFGKEGLRGMSIARTEDGDVIRQCVDCERWFEETELFAIRDEDNRMILYHLCNECFKEEQFESRFEK